MNVVEFYDRHPISAAQVLAAARRQRGGAALRAEDLFPFDQDHYGGLAAVDALARLAGIGPHSRILDVCAGLGGPARFLASRRGCRVVALELNAGRAEGAARLSRLVGLGPSVRVVRGDAAALPFGAGRFDACLSQEALLHVADKAAVLQGAHRVLVPGGRLVFTDWIARPRLGDAARRRLQAWMAATTLQSLDGYRALLGRAGFTAVEAEDLSDEWRPLLQERLRMFRAMGPDTIARLGEAR
ncbi:MAG TPA: methyltransferase domain-containing protein, partial [Methylomirabilota bacterium]|nr:methyltransferase domain-containing protein [Methylomirabilota bacterium]